MNSVSSNAVAKKYFESIDLHRSSTEVLDMLAIAESMPLNNVSWFRCNGSQVIHSPYSDGEYSCDFTCCVNRMDDPNYLTIIARDVRSNNVYACSKINGTWGSWTCLSTQMIGAVPKNHYLRIFFDKPFICTTLHIQVQGAGDHWVNIYWFGAANGAVNHVYDDNNFLKVARLNGSIGSLTYTWGNGFIDIINPNDEPEAFVISGNVKFFAVSS